MTDSPVLALAKDLISRQSVTPEDAGCQQVMIDRLQALGFDIEVMVFEDTTNFWARRGTQAHCLPLPVTPMLSQQVLVSSGIHHHLNQP